MRVLIALFIMLAIPASGFSTTWYVPDDFSKIQEAISDLSVVDGDTIIVKPGTYVENIDFLGKAIVVKSEQGPDITILDGNQVKSVVTFASGEEHDSILDGFTITNGVANSHPNYDGGGILCANSSSPTILNNIISGNLATYGGGIHCKDSSPEIKANIISGNTGEYDGGGILCDNSASMITDNTVMGNASGSGGGIECRNSTSTIYKNTISGNSGFSGGGIECCNSLLEILDNIISGNSASYGGGIYCDKASPVIKNNTIIYNTAYDPLQGGGGGIYCLDPSSKPVISNNVIAGNWSMDTGGGICCYDGSSPVISNNMIYGNSTVWGGGIFCEQYSVPVISNNTITQNIALSGGGLFGTFSSPVITNTILWDDTPDEVVVVNGSPTITYSNIQGGWPGMGNIDDDPLFVDSADNDFHVFYNSPCRDSGDNNAPNLPSEDFEGDPRITYGTVDMGADEVHTHLYYTGDATPGGIVKVKIVGMPGTTPVGLCIGGGVLDPPLPSIWGDWYLKFPIIGPVDLGTIPAPDGVLVIPGSIPGSVPAPYSFPMQVLIGIELTNLCVMYIE